MKPLTRLFPSKTTFFHIPTTKLRFFVKFYLHSTRNLILSLLLMDSDNNTPKRSRTPRDFTFLDTQPLSRYVTETGKILPRRITGLTAIQQRHIARQIKRARNMLLMK